MNQQKGKASYQLEGICESGTNRHIRIQQAIENMKNVFKYRCRIYRCSRICKTKKSNRFRNKRKKWYGNKTIP